MNASTNNKIALLFLSLMMASSTKIYAEMQSLSDSDLSEVDGQGIGLVMDDFIFSHGHNPSEGKVFRISGVTNSAGEDVVINVNQMYIARAGSNYGETLEGVNLGRLTNPYEIDLLNGDDPDIGLPGEAVLEFAAPRKVLDTAQGYDCLTGAAGGECSSRPSSAEWVNGERPDLGLELEINDGALASNLNINVESAVFDGSYLRLWGDDGEERMAAEFRLNFYSPSIEVSTCEQINQGCSSSIKMSNFQMELALGHTFQPLYIGVDGSSNLPTSGGLTLQIAKITHPYMDKINVVDGSYD
ncbi:hypothetical protein A3752_16120, partial [Oleiphilus sp. HI0081]